MKAVTPEAAAAAGRKWLAADHACIVEVVPEDTKVGADDQAGGRQDGSTARIRPGLRRSSTNAAGPERRWSVKMVPMLPGC
jgi:hypothetical protein